MPAPPENWAVAHNIILLPETSEHIWEVLARLTSCCLSALSEKLLCLSSPYCRVNDSHREAILLLNQVSYTSDNRPLHIHVKCAALCTGYFCLCCVKVKNQSAEWKRYLRSGKALPSDATCICMAGSSWSFSTSAILVRISFSQSSFELCEDGAAVSVQSKRFPNPVIYASRVSGRILSRVVTLVEFLL